MPVRRISPPDKDTEDAAALVQVARSFYVEGLTQAQVAARHQLSQSSVSRLLLKARNDKIVRVYIEPPRLQWLEAKLKEALAPKGVERICLVPSGPEDNTSNLGVATAHMLADLLTEQVQANRETIRIVMSCGATLGAGVESFRDLLDRDPDLLATLTGKRLQVYPSAVHADSLLDMVLYPSALVAAFTFLLMNHFKSVFPIEGHIPSLPPQFYRQPERQRQAYVKKYQLSSLLTCMKESDIFLLGIGMTTNINFERIEQQIGIPIDRDEFPAESNNIPIRRDGTQHDEIARALLGINIEELRHTSRQPGRIVMAVAGGPRKKEAIAAAVANPYFNTLITDEENAQNLLAHPVH